MTTTDKLADIIRKRGYKLTPQRRAVLEVITTSPDHLTPAAAYERVQRHYPSIGLVTVYRILEVLAELNLICRVQTEDGHWSYSMRRQGGHHHHVVCSSCGKVEDFTECDLGGTEQRLARETGFNIQSHLLQFNGICPNCLGERHDSSSTEQG